MFIGNSPSISMLPPFTKSATCPLAEQSPDVPPKSANTSVSPIRHGRKALANLGVSYPISWSSARIPVIAS